MHKSYPEPHESGFTLVEMLVSVSILAIIAGAAYAVFKTSIDAYHQTEARILAAQRTRVALDRLVTDLKHFQASPEEPDFVLYTQDVPSESGERDMLSFVTLVRTDPDPFLAQLNAGRGGSQQNLARLPPLVSDVQRVAYFVRADMPPGETGRNALPSANADAQTEELALYRVTTTALNPEVAIGSLIETGTAPQTDENGEPIYFQIATLVTGIVNFDLKYLDDQETWYDSWDQEDSNPVAVRILITVRGEEQPPLSLEATQVQPAATQPNVMNQSTMVALPQPPAAPEEQGGPPQ